MAEQSLVITFTTAEVIADADTIKIELDSEYNNNRSQFNYGEKAYYKIYTYPVDYTIVQIPSDGIITSENSGEQTITEQLVFSTTESTGSANTNQSLASHPVKSINATQWLTENEDNRLGSISADGIQITASKFGIGVLWISYVTEFRRFALSVPPRYRGGILWAEYKITVYVNTEAP